MDSSKADSVGQRCSTAHELLLPVGNAEMALAAIHNGADAVYIGFPGFNARGRSHDHEVDELKALIEQCHLHGVKVNLAFNVVIFQDELAQVVPLLERILPLKPDALIIQDLGLVRLVREMAPDQPIHASTQMTVTNADAIALVEDLGIARFVLGRENSLKEIALIRAQTDKDLEVFVHGALCVSYSGQCFTSESIGGRSANRGQCAQSCRFGYEMYVDGEKRDLPDKKYLVSPQDLCGISEIPALMDLGVRSFKVEGRLKSPEYVAAAAHEYRAAIDRHSAGAALSEKEQASSRSQMAATYSRGFFSGWLHGVDHQRLVEGTGKSHRGAPIGTVVEIRGGAMFVELEKGVELSPGDGLLWSHSVQGEPADQGAQIYEVRPSGGRRHEIRFGNEVALSEEFRGARLHLSHDASQKRELRRSFEDKNLKKKIPVSIAVEATEGTPLRVSMTDGRFTAVAEGAVAVERAKSQAVDDAFFAKELGALGGTAFKVRDCTVARGAEQGHGVFYPRKDLKEIRRRLTADLERLRAQSRISGRETAIRTAAGAMAWVERQKSGSGPAHAPETRLTVLLREKAQVMDLLATIGGLERETLDCVILDFEFGMDYEASITALRQAGVRCGIATTRILKPREYTHFTRIERLAPDVILIRNLGALHYFTAVRPFAGELRGDFSLNVTNHLSAQYLLGKGLRTVTASYDLNGGQLAELLAATDPSALEVTVHQHMPSFHMEHCVFAAYLSSGSSFRDCGKPCERHRVELKDQFGNRHQLKADPECRNTMYNAAAQSAARYVESWVARGIGLIRYEALYERGDELIKRVRGYQDLLARKRSAAEVTSDLRILENYGLGEGPIARHREYVNRKKEAPRADRAKEYP